MRTLSEKLHSAEVAIAQCELDGDLTTAESAFLALKAIEVSALLDITDNLSEINDALRDDNGDVRPTRSFNHVGGPR